MTIKERGIDYVARVVPQSQIMEGNLVFALKLFLTPVERFRYDSNLRIE